MKISLTIKTKATLLAIAIGVIPVTLVGFLAHNFTSRSLTAKIRTEQLEKNEIAAEEIGRFLEDRARELEALVKYPIFTDSKLRENSTLAEKTAILDNFAQEIKYYSSILHFDLQGDLLYQASIEKPYTKNYGSKGYFQAAIATEKTTINGPGLNSKGQLRVEFAVPIKDKATGKVVSVLRAKVPGNYLNHLFRVYEEKGDHWNLINADGIIFAGDSPEALKQPLAAYSSEIDRLHQAGKNGVLSTMFNLSKKSLQNQQEEAVETQKKDGKQIVSYVVAPPPEQFPDVKIGATLTKDQDIAYADVNKLGLILLVGTFFSAMVVVAIAAYLANRATIPLINAVQAVKKIGRGKLDTRLAVTGDDELGELNSNINLMARQIQNSLQEQKNLAEQQRQQKEQLETAIHTLIGEVSDATDGDLTVRANLDSMELSTIADLFNAIIDNLQEIAIETKQSSGKVGSSLKRSEVAILKLAEQAMTEAKETRDSLTSIAYMSESIQNVAENASEAEQIADDTYNTVVSSSSNMDLTVNSILALRNTVGETAKRMKTLGESSEKISQAVSFIEEIAFKTNVLAINASAEADRAGEYGQGFIIIAEQVGALAKQSTAATKEIASIATAIQFATEEVSQAMKSGNTQVIESARLVEASKKSLGLVLEKSQKINQLMESVSQATISQAGTSRQVNNLMEKIALLSETTSKSSTEVARSIVATAEVAQKLESTVAQFKVAESSSAT